MNNFKSPYDSNQIREGLMNIKQSQMELLKELKNQNHILKKYSPTDTIYQQKSQSNIYNSSSPSYSLKQNFQNNFPSQNHKNSYISPNPSYFSNHRKQSNQEDNYKFSSTSKNLHNNSMIQKQLETMTQQFHRMKKNYFTQKQKNKDMVLHMQFAASLHNLILKQALQGINIDSIKTKVRNQVQNYQSQFTQFKAFGLQQAFNIINLQSDNSFLQSRNSTPRRTPIFPQKIQNPMQNVQLLKQINDLKCQLKQLSLQKQRKSQLVTLIKGQNDYSLSLLNKELEMKNGKINQLVSELLKVKEINRNITNQNIDIRNNIQRLKSQFQRNLNKIQTLQSFQKKTNQTIQKQHKYMKYLTELQQKLSYSQKQSKQKSKLIQIHQQNLNKTNQLFRSIKTENQKLKKQIEEISHNYKQKTYQLNHLQQKHNKSQASHIQQLKTINKRNQAQQLSLKQHIQQLKKNVHQLLMQQQYRKQSQMVLQQIKNKKIQTLKFSKTVEHLWRIKQVEYENVNQILTQLNSIKMTLSNNAGENMNNNSIKSSQLIGSSNFINGSQIKQRQSRNLNGNQETVIGLQNKQTKSSRSKSKNNIKRA